MADNGNPTIIGVEPSVHGDPRDCWGSQCPHWSIVLGDCLLSREERICGQRASRAERAERQGPWPLYKHHHNGAAEEAQFRRMIGTGR
jgi:hypothetical protein